MKKLSVAVLFAVLCLGAGLLLSCSPGEDDDPVDGGAGDNDDDDDDDDNHDDDTSPADDDDDNNDNDTSPADDDDDDDDDIPDDIMNPPDEMPFTIEREPEGTAPTAQEIADFTDTMKSFYEDVGYFRWASRHSVGLAENNEWGQPGYKIWWGGVYGVKAGATVTYTWEGPEDNSTLATARIMASAIGAFLSTGDVAARDLALGYIKGLSACYDGMVWPTEDPPIDSIMARTIFHRNHTYEGDGGRMIAVDYEPVRYEDFARRHDTIHNPENPTYGDIWVRNKRSKDDLPPVYRNQLLLARLIRQTDDEELRNAAIKLYRQIGRMATDIVENGYHIRTKGVDGEIFIPRTEAGIIDDFASFTTYDFVAPLGECDAKLSTAYLATGGDSLDNDCNDGRDFLYELFANFSHDWSADIIWGYHLSALSLALGYGDNETALRLLQGMAARSEEARASFFRQRYLSWDPKIAQLLVLAAAYGLPLTHEEAQYVMEHFAASAAHYSEFTLWDLWSPSIPDGEYGPIPTDTEYDDLGQPVLMHVRINEMADIYEYCDSPLKAPNGALFVDCDRLLGVK